MTKGMKCVNCERELKEADLFCRFCGTRVQKLQPLVLCPLCHEGNNPGSSFCEYCGAALSVPAVEENEERTKFAAVPYPSSAMLPPNDPDRKAFNSDVTVGPVKTENDIPEPIMQDRSEKPSQRKKGNPLLYILVVVFVLVVLAAVGVIYALQARSEVATDSPAEATPEAEPLSETAEPVSTDAPYSLLEEEAFDVAVMYWESYCGISEYAGIESRGKKTCDGADYCFFILKGERPNGSTTAIDYLYVNLSNGDCYFGIETPEELVVTYQELLSGAISPNISSVQPQEEVQFEPLAITYEDQYRLNIFLSNFSEQYFHELPAAIVQDDGSVSLGFDIQNADPMELIDFAYKYIKINRNSMEVVWADGVPYYCIGFDSICSVTERFFRKSVYLQDAINSGSSAYNNDYVIIDGMLSSPAADGESYNRMTVVKRLLDMGNGKLLAEFDVYVINRTFDDSFLSPSGAIQDKSVYYFTKEDAQSKPYSRYCCSGQAVLSSDIDANGEEHFCLEAYQIL
ncbi:MAG: zinc ribbon domain-containing protein [Faecousia sp.]